MNSLVLNWFFFLALAVIEIARRSCWGRVFSHQRACALRSTMRSMTRTMTAYHRAKFQLRFQRRQARRKDKRVPWISWVWFEEMYRHI
jgi:hypothetical protein